MPEVSGSNPKHVKPSNINSWTNANVPFQFNVASSAPIYFFLSSTTFLSTSCFQAAPSSAFSAPSHTQPWPSYSIGISGKWPQTRNLSSKITNTTLRRCFKEVTLHIAASVRLLPHDASFAGFGWKSNLLNWYTSTTNDMHIALPSARMSQYSVIIEDYFVKVNPDLQGPNE